MEELEELYLKYLQTLEKQKFNPEELDYSKVEHYCSLLKYLDELESNSYEIFDLYKKDHLFFSHKFETMLGFDIDKTLENWMDNYENRIHPEDRVGMLKVGNYFIEKSFELPNAEKSKYKLINDFRILGKENEYVRVMKQYKALELDRQGNIWLALCILSISPDSDIAAPLKSRVVNLETGELFYYPRLNEPQMIISPLSERELQILELISRGFSSKIIADKLFISVNTVNTHRQRIIEKLNVSNTFEAVKSISDLGLIG